MMELPRIWVCEWSPQMGPVRLLVPQVKRGRHKRSPSVPFTEVRSVCRRMTPPLVTMLSAEPEIQYAPWARVLGVRAQGLGPRARSKQSCAL